MPRRHATAALVLLVVLALPTGCASDAEPAAPEQDDSEPAAPEASSRPVVPPLHAEIDDLDEAVARITTTGGDVVEVVAKVAATDEERRRGLMEVTELPDGVGMLFLFEEERTNGFWMWNTLIELDIAFAAADGEVVAVETMVPCRTDRADCPTTAPVEPYATALEVAGGGLTDAGVTPGAQLTWSEPVPAG